MNVLLVNTWKCDLEPLRAVAAPDPHADLASLPPRKYFAELMRRDGFDLRVANALRQLRAGSSVKGGGWQRLLQRTIKWNQRRQARDAQPPALPGDPAGRPA